MAGCQSRWTVGRGWGSIDILSVRDNRFPREKPVENEYDKRSDGRGFDVRIRRRSENGPAGHLSAALAPAR